jgi:hypothetical protein
VENHPKVNDRDARAVGTRSYIVRSDHRGGANLLEPNDTSAYSGKAVPVRRTMRFEITKLT